MNPTHFQEGQVSFDQMYALFQEMAALGLEFLTYKAVAICDQNEVWVPFASILRNDFDSQSSQSVIRIGQVAHISVCHRVQDLKKVDDLRTFLASWKTLLDGRSVAPSYADQFQLNRMGAFSIYGWNGRNPCWQGTLQEIYEDGRHLMTHHGPFLSPEFGIFKQTIGGLAAWWIGIPGYEGEGQPRSQMQCVISDPRARFISGHHSGLQIELQVAALPSIQSDLFCGFSAKDFDGNPHSNYVAITDGRVNFTLPTPCREIDVFLCNREGYWFDRLIESEHFCEAPFSMLGLFQRNLNAGSEDLQQALSRGEGEHIEFKEWMPVEREKSKSIELLKTACAFANTNGGVLYIGVNKELEVRGVAKQLYDWNPKKDLEEMRILYAKQISQLIDEGISPPIRKNIEWVTHAGLYVLRIDITASAASNHYIVENSQTFVRRGANCKHATVHDLQALVTRPRLQ